MDVRAQGSPGYASGFIIFIGMAIVSLLLAYLLHRTNKVAIAR